ncbi:uncharacterized protein LOC120074263 isoform X1 [Benincasa hispida]|uniref:uncharacterized protein LOC120074263 isoform X1 n=1 Tax=Benincasa hispida TaxID=102211 RepID=UPI00190043EA|nr:uncharacterized protein LOC120074263 isoform X1 [Benincasa hispida]
MEALIFSSDDSLGRSKDGYTVDEYNVQLAEREVCLGSYISRQRATPVYCPLSTFCGVLKGGLSSSFKKLIADKALANETYIGRFCCPCKIIIFVLFVICVFKA